MLCERPHDVVQALAHQNHRRARSQCFRQSFNSFLFQARLQEIFKEFFTQQVQPVAAHPAQNAVQQPRCEHAIRAVKDRPSNSEKRHSSPARPPLQKALRVPGKKGHGPHCRQIQQAPLYPPEHTFARTGSGGVSLALRNIRNVIVWLRRQHREWFATNPNEDTKLSRRTPAIKPCGR